MIMTQFKITDVFFDLDHTLWDFDKNSALAFQRVFVKHQLDLNFDSFIMEYEPINLIYWKKYREDLIDKQQMRRGRLLETFQKLNIVLSITDIDALAHTYIEELPVDNHLCSGATEVLEYLNTKYKLHIITNGFREVQHLKLRKSNIEKYFTTVTTSEDVGRKKPHPSIFDFALRKAVVTAQNAIMIGDSFEADILGAEAAGMHSLFFNYKNQKVVPPFVDVKTLLDIKIHL